MRLMWVDVSTGSERKAASVRQGCPPHLLRTTLLHLPMTGTHLMASCSIPLGLDRKLSTVTLRACGAMDHCKDIQCNVRANLTTNSPQVVTVGHYAKYGGVHGHTAR